MNEDMVSVKRSLDYLMTIEMDEFAEGVIQTVRKTVNRSNAMARMHGIDDRYFVRVRGRLGKNNPNRSLYAVGGPLYKAASQDIKLEHAARADIYISKRGRRWR